MNGINSVIVAEDDNEDYYVFEHAMNEVSKDVKMTRAENGEILMSLLASDLPDVLFLDLLMPCKDGKQCIREIRKESRYDQLPVIVFTSVDAPDSIRYCHTEGANLYALKPYRFDDLIHFIQKVFSISWKDNMTTPGLPTFVLRN